MNEKKSVLIGITGGIAAYKIASLVRLFKKAHWNVIVAMTKNAMEFITPLTFETLSGNPVITDNFERSLPVYGSMEHISLADSIDAFVCAPATGNIIAKAASGLADDILSTTILALKSETPKIICPAMNVRMYQNPATQENLRTLHNRGFVIIEPDAGELACGVEGKGRLPKEEVIFAVTEREVSGKPLEGRKIIVTSGATVEPIDPVRYITNHSSGKMGLALAQECWRLGADVRLISGRDAVPGVTVPQERVTSAEEMKDAVMTLIKNEGADLVIMTAAVADYTPEQRENQKIKKGEGALTLRLKRTPDIISVIKKECDIPVVGFAAESDHVLDYAREKLKKKGLALIVANDITQKEGGFRSDFNRCYVITPEKTRELERMTKKEAARYIVEEIIEIFKKKDTQ